MGLLKKFCEMVDQAWEDYLYYPATQLPSLFEVANIDAKWLPFLKPLLGFTRDLSFEATEAELRRILGRAVPFWNDKPSELGSIDHAIRMVTGNRFRLRSYFDHRMATDETCVTEEAEDFDPMVIDFFAKVKRGLTVEAGGPNGTNYFKITAGMDEPFDTPYAYRFLVIEEPADLKMSWKIDRLVVHPTELVGYTERGEFPAATPTVCVASIYGTMDEYATEVRLVDDRHGDLDFDQESVAFTAGERIRGATTNARASVLTIARAGAAGTMVLGRVHSRFQDNEVLMGSRGGRAYVKGKMRNILNRELLYFLLEVNRPLSERYDLTYISFLDEFHVTSDLDQWNHSGGVTVPAPGSEALMPAGSMMVCNDPRAVLQDYDGDGSSDEGWDNYTARWKVITDSASTIVDLVFRWLSWSNHFLIRFNMTTKVLQLIRVMSGAETLLAWSAVQAYLKPGVQDTVRVDTFIHYSNHHVVSRVVLDGEEVIPWTDDSSPSSLGGPVGVKVTGAGAVMKMVEVNVWPTESGLRMLTGDA